MSKIIAFSGGCFSGKTTCMEYIKEHVANCVIVSEYIRELWQGSIDELRSDPNKYLEIQKEIALKRVKVHAEAVKDTSDTIYLEDRSLADTFFYFTNYIDIKQLDEEHLELYYWLIDYTTQMCRYQHYNKVFIFEPLVGIKNTDKMRPEGVEETNKWEYKCIKALDHIFYKDICEDINVQKQSYEEIISKII